MTGQRISDMTALTALDTDGTTVPVVADGVNYKLNLNSILNAGTLTLERYGGGTAAAMGAGFRNDAAWTLLLAVLNAAAAPGGIIHLFEGTYKFAAAATLPANSSSLTIEGEGFLSVMQQMTAGQSVLALPSAGTAHNLTLRKFTMQGPGWNSAGTSHGFTMPSNAVESFNMLFEDLYISEVSGDSLNVGTQAFTAAFRRVGMDLFGRHGIYGGNNTWLLENCYAHNAKGTATLLSAAYRITGGVASLVGCNGLDTGDIWGDFGMSTLDGDAADSYATVSMIGCNVEDFAEHGVRLRLGNLDLINTGFIGKAGASGLIALLSRPADGGGIGGLLDNAGTFALGAGASWANSLPVHTVTNDEAPFALVLGGSDPTETFQWRDDTAAATKSMPITRLKLLTATKWGAAYTDVNLSGIISTLNTAGNATDLGNYANDAAAAAGGIAVGQCYRNGSIVMVRVA